MNRFLCFILPYTVSLVGVLNTLAPWSQGFATAEPARMVSYESYRSKANATRQASTIIQEAVSGKIAAHAVPVATTRAARQTTRSRELAQPETTSSARSSSPRATSRSSATVSPNSHVASTPLSETHSREPAEQTLRPPDLYPLPPRGRGWGERAELAPMFLGHFGDSTLGNPHSPRLDQSYGRLPLSFEPNVGQTEEQVKFLSRGRGYTMFLTANEAVLALRGREDVKRESLPAKRAAAPVVNALSEQNNAEPRTSNAEQSIMRMRFEGANANAQIEGHDQLPGIANYFLGSDPHWWRTNVPTFGTVRYKDLYPGIDLIYYGNQHQLEYDLVVAPGADPNQIKLTFKGTNKIDVDDATGDLVLTFIQPSENSALNAQDSARARSAVLRLRKPLVYQQGEDGHKHMIAGRYILAAAETQHSALSTQHSASVRVHIQLTAYDHTAPLIIDPVLQYSTYLGGSGSDQGNGGVAVDAAGQAYVTGWTDSTNFPTLNASQPVFGGTADVFVTKFDAVGARVYSTYLGGSGFDQGAGIAVDAAGQAYVTGDTNSPNFPALSASQPVFGGAVDAFLTKLNAAGGLVSSTYLGGADVDQGYGIGVDAAGGAYVTGQTVSTDFPMLNASQALSGGAVDAFVAKYKASGARVYSTYLGGSANDSGYGIAVDTAGQAYLTGTTQSANFPTLNPSQASSGGGSNDAFVTKLDAVGARVYSTYLGGSGSESGNGIAVDFAGQAYVAGETNSTNFPVLNPSQPAFGGGSNDTFVAKLDAVGARIYSTYLGGSDSDQGFDIAIDAAGQADVTGNTSSTNFPTVNATQIASGGGSNDAFVTKFDTAGTRIYSTYLGGSASDQGFDIAVDAAGQMYVTGNTSSANFPTASASQAASGGGLDTFVAKICNDQTGAPGTFSPSGSLSIARHFATATRLADGRILIAGGQQGGENSPSGVQATAELYDPASGTFSSTATTMVRPRTGHTATLLANGQVLIVGGSNGSGENVTFELFNPTTGGFSATTETLSTARTAHTATLLADGRVLIVGGRNTTGTLSDAEIYSPVTGTFSTVAASMVEGRSAHTATLLADGRVLLAGGFGVGALDITNSAELFDAAANGGAGGFAAAGNMTSPRRFHTATVLANGKVLMAGGETTLLSDSFVSSAELYTPATNSFVATGSMSTPRSKSDAAVRLHTGKVLLAGGKGPDSAGPGTDGQKAVEIYDPTTGTFSQTGSLGTAREFHSTMVLADGDVLVIGGFNAANNALTSSEVYTVTLCGPEIQTPQIMSLSPTTGPVATSVTINGSNFGPTQGTSTVTFNGTVAPSAPTWTNTQVILRVPSGATTGPIVVTVNAVSSNVDQAFTVGAAAPTIADLSLTVSDNPDPAPVGSNVTYTMVVTNNGPDTALNVNLTTTVPQNTTFVSASSGCTGTASISCSASSLNVSSTTTFTVVVTGNTVGTKTLTASVTASNNTDNVSANNTNITQTTLITAAGVNTFVVNSTGDAGDVNTANNICQTSTAGECTLRAAMQQANVTANGVGGPDVIVFNIPGGGVKTISPTSALPTITESIIIDGTTQPGFPGTPIIELNGAGAGAATNGLLIAAGQSTVRGLVINRFTASGLRIQTAGGNQISGGNVIAGNYIGTNAAGTAALANAGGGVLIISTSLNTVGGNVPSARNVISGNGFFGVSLQGGTTNNGVRGNFIGTNATGMVALPNNGKGVQIQGASTNNTVGGVGTPPGTGQGNVISGNDTDGIFIQSAGTTGNRVLGNLIGTNATGDSAVANGGDGISVTVSASNTIIGSNGLGNGNVISGNGQRGIFLIGSATANIVQRNFIGTNAAGTGAVPNLIAGVQITGANNVIGGTAAAFRNVISGNTGPNLLISQATANGNIVQGNYIGTNAVGTAPLANGGEGVVVNSGAVNNTIGGTTAGAGNVISGHTAVSQIPGVLITGVGTSGNIVQGNFIGTDATGNAAVPNNSGVSLTAGATGNTIGGPSAAARNVISGNTFGVFIRGATTQNNAIQGNFIGVQPNGTNALPNLIGVLLDTGATGVTIGGANATPGGACTGACNVISGNGTGVQMTANNGPATGNHVEGNYIGTDLTGTLALPNNSGVNIVGTNGNVIGGITAAVRNVISGNSQNGVLLQSAGTTSNVVQGNYIGTNAGGTGPLPNGASGVAVMTGASNNTIGGTAVGSRNVISGNAIYGIDINGSSGAAGNNFIQGNFIGTDSSGTADLGNGNNGVYITAGSMNNLIGGVVAGARNIISGNNGAGIVVDTSNNNTIQGNYIGTDVNGTADLGNTNSGIHATQSANTAIGGLSSLARNIISGNDSAGVLLQQAGTTGTVVQGNYIGTNAAGNASLPNIDGIFITDAPGNMVGGSAAGAGNVISGNNRYGVDIENAGSTGNQIQGNFIGTNPGGTVAVSNVVNGIRISNGAGSNTIGGTAAAAQNVVAYNTGVGVVVVDATSLGNTILGNAIFANETLGIDLENNGVTPNDSGDGDTGSNNLQNFPALTSAVNGGGSTLIQGTFNSTANTTFRLEFFSNQSCDSGGFGEGQTFLGNRNVTSDGSGNTSFTFYYPFGIPAGQFITSTATDSGNNTSEFSACRVVAALASIAVTPTNPSITVGQTQQFTATGTFSDGSSRPLAGSGTWGATGSLNAGRGYHTATILSNGRVLIAGGLAVGSNPSTLLSSAELYDPAAGTFSAAGSMGTARFSAAASLLSSGKALMTGGRDASNQMIASAELYDPATGLFTSAGSMTAPRGDHTSTVLPNGAVLIVGGHFTTAAELYDAVSGAFTASGDMTTSRVSHSATLLLNGKVLIVGGRDSGNASLSSAELYDPVTGAFSLTGPLPGPRNSHTATLLTDGRVLIAGGVNSTTPLASALLYDPATGNFSATTGSLGTARLAHTATLLPNGRVLIAGGNTNGAGFTIVASSELYDPATGTFVQTPAMASARVSQTATMLSSGRVLVAGGLDNGNIGVAAAELYAAQDITWSSGTPAIATLNAGSLATAVAVGTTAITATQVGSLITGNTTLTVTSGNNAPVAVADSAAVAGNSGANVINVLANDTDPDNLTPPLNAGLIITGVTQGTKGAVAIASGGVAVTYTPTLNATGADSFTYTISDGALTSTAAVTMSITAVGGGGGGNLPPVLTTPNQTVNEGALLQVTLTGSDPEAQPVTITNVSGLPSGATFASASNQLTWMPAPNQSGVYPIQVTLSDGTTSVTPVFTITVVETIADQDLDGVPDAATGPYPQDNCVAIFNPSQTDFDGDGVGDLCDVSPVGAAFIETNGQPDPKITNQAVIIPPANGTAYQPAEPIFMTATVTFRRVDRTGDGIADKYFVVHPDPYNVFLDVVNNGIHIHVNRIPEAPALHIPNSLIEIPGGTDPCPLGTTQVNAPGTPDHLACRASTVIDVTDSRSGILPGTVTITPTYFNYIQDPEYHAFPTPEDPTPCTTEAQGCFSPIWMGTAPAPAQSIQVAAPPPGTPAPTELTAQGSVTPATWDLRWDILGATGFVDILLGNLAGLCPTGATCTVEQIVRSQVRLNGMVLPSSTELLTSASGFTGKVLRLRYPQASAMQSLKALASATVIAGQPASLLLAGVLTSNGLPTGTPLATLRATPTVMLTADPSPTLLDALMTKMQGLSGVSSSVKNSLIVKLQDAQKLLNQDNLNGACGKLNDFINLTMAQSGKGLTVPQANDVIADATFIKKLIGCR